MTNTHPSLTPPPVTGPADANRRVDQDRLVARIATELMASGDEDLDRHLLEALRLLGQFLEADRAYLFSSEAERLRGQISHQWTAPGVPPRFETGQLVDFAGFPWLRRRFVEDGWINIHRMEDLPAGADLERRSLSEAGVKSMIVLASLSSDGAEGALCAQATSQPRQWNEDDRHLLQVINGLITAALDRRRATEALRTAEARQRAMLDALPDMVFAISPQGVITDVHAPSDVELPIDPKRLLNASLDRVMPERIAALLIARVRATLTTGKPQTVQYMLPIGENRRFYEVRFAPRNGEDVLAVVRDITDRKSAEEQLQEQEKLYEILVQSTLDAIVLSDRHGKILSWNPGASRMFGYTSSEMIGQPLTKLTPDYASGRAADVASFMESGKSGMLNRVVELWGQRKAGDLFPVEMTLSAWTASGETLLASVIRDIQERRDAETLVRESEQRYRQLVQNSADGILLHDESGRLVDVNDRTVEMLGYTRDELLCMTMMEFERDTLTEGHQQVWSTMRPEQAVTLEGTYQRSDGSQFPVEMRLAKFQGSAAGPLILVIARDVTERKAAEAALLEHRQRLRHLASQLTLTEERQRRELAVQLHDGIGQELAMCRLRLQTYQSSPDGKKTPQHLDHALNYVNQAITRVQSLTFDISPPALHELGLPAALRSLGRRIQEDHGLVFEYEQTGDETPLSKELEVLLFRTVRELAINVVKHARANTLRVSLRKTSSQVEIAVADDGVGIQNDEIDSKTSPTEVGFGLFSVRERLSSVQGSLELHNAAGTIATIVVPTSEHTPYAYMLGGKT